MNNYMEKNNSFKFSEQCSIYGQGLKIVNFQKFFGKDAQLLRNNDNKVEKKLTN